MSARLAGRSAIVTGAGNGLGRAISLALAAEGVDVIAMGRQVEPLQAVVNEIAALGGRGIISSCNIADPASVGVAMDELAGEEISILINNAGVAGPVAKLVDIDPHEWDDVFATNVRGPYLMCRAVLPGMLGRGAGDIINVASVAAKRPLIGRTPYGASKAALLGLTTTLAAEVAEAGVVVNALSPGPVAGPRMERNFRLEAQRRGISPERAEEDYVSKAASKRMVTPEEVGAAVVAILRMSGLIGVDIDLSAGMFAR